VNMNICDISQSFSSHLQCLGLIVSPFFLVPLQHRLTFIVVKWCLDNSISSQVTTPVTGQDLSSALISALESNTVSPVSAPNDVTFDILLAEDNLVNQKLAVKILEKYGHTVEIAENGSLAVDAFKGRVAQNKPFDIILVRCRFIFNYFDPSETNGLDGCVYAFHGRYGSD
jgi:hypothetical protein